MGAGRALLGAAASAGLAFGAGAGELGYPASALEEFAQKERPSFDTAPPLAPGAGSLSNILAPPSAAPAPSDSPPSAPAPSEASPPPSPEEAPAPAPQGAKSAPAQESAGALDEYEARCFVKIDGKVLVSRGCRILRDGGKSVVFEIEDGPLTIDFRQGRVWTARFKDRDFGNVYKTGECWGAHGFYACDRGRR